MSIIKLEIRLGELTQAIEAFKNNRKAALEAFSSEMRHAVGKTINDLMNAEIDVFLGRSDQEDNKRNGYHPEREYVLKGFGGLRIRTPRTARDALRATWYQPTSARIHGSKQIWLSFILPVFPRARWQ